MFRQFLRSHANVHRAGKKVNVFVFSMPRSGSTWLMELIWSQPGFKYVNEPLNLKSAWLRDKSCIGGFDELYRLGAKDKVVSYFQGFVNGKFHFLDPNPLRQFYRPFTSRIVFKVIHGGELFINDVVDRCNGKVLYLLRHPIAVALSRQQLPRMDHLCSNFVLDHFETEEKRYALHVRQAGNIMQQKILAWCIQNKLALLQRRDDWVVLTYEQLVLFPRAVVEKLTHAFDLPECDRLLKQLNIPSAVTVQSERATRSIMRDGGTSRSQLVNKWLNKMSAEEIQTCLDVCKQMNFLPYNCDTGLPSAEWLV